MEWERTDTYLVSAHSPDCIVRVWRSSTGELVSKLKVQEVKINLNKARNNVDQEALPNSLCIQWNHTIMWTLLVISNNLSILFLYVSL